MVGKGAWWKATERQTKEKKKSLTCSVLACFCAVVTFDFDGPRYRMGCLAMNSASPKQGGAGVG